ncbi:hypothetical protein BP6252_07997 [Coleophoma cylindrospora]|uniref:[histone H3]-trimethyl-L-lysine(9) demethylase n=1 Tax=Coleophoma cylindrospora TaxID=1849047 RepID=A0A3D8RC37_9HELO|nr:hypothetical protein BP6252_07997 [Coleophoma cylindrospora]
MDTEMIEAGLPDSAAVPEAAGGLHSPPDSNNTLHDGSDSDLSELGEDPEEDIGIIVPDHVENGVPVFIPSMAQFKSFKIYMDKINAYGMKSGIVKVIPPAEWRDKLPALDEAIKTIRVKEPIKQDIMGTSGTYRQANIVHQRSYNLPQWRQLCEQSEHQPPAKRGERRANQDKPPPRPKTQSAPGGSAKKLGRSKKGSKKGKAAKSESGQTTPDRLPTPVSPAIKPQEDSESIKCEVSDEEEETPSKVRGGRQPKATTVGARRKFNRREAAGKIDEEAFKDFKYKLEGEDFSPERCEELERAYWKTLTYAPPLYGADMPGSLFDDRTESWNLGKLENLLDVMGTKIPGVNTAYLYLGMWKATFAWHLEDVDLYSINIVHFGAPKQWYSISQGDARKFENAMKTIFPTDAKACDQFLRHKTFLISPSHLLQNYGIKVNKIVAHPGEFVITFPYGYHSGYNLGYNCAEAVNFALDSWLEYGRVAKKCDCSQAQDSVWIDVREIERKLRGEETDYEETEDEEEEDDEEEPTDLPTPPDSSSSDSKVKIPQKKRKRPANDKGDRTVVKKIRVRIKLPLKEPCILCPNDLPSEPLLPTDDGRKAHRICALYIPETTIEEGETPTAVDIQYIDKARLELKCNFCHSKKGACFQCSQKKCTRAYHATCAAAAGVFVEQGEIPVFGEDGTEYKDQAIEFSCRFHRSKRDKKVDEDMLAADEDIHKAASQLAVGSTAQLQYLRDDIFAGLVAENRHVEQKLLLDLLPGGDRVEVDYRWLLVPDPSDYHLPKPSANAIPMPKTRKEKLDLNTSKRAADDNPRTDDIFLPGYKYAEFKCEKIAKNPAQVNVDFTKENQIWFYLGKTSTEAKAQFTEDIRKPVHNPKGHFLDTILRTSNATISAPRQSFAASYPTKINYHALNTAKANRPSPLHNSLQASTRPEKPYVYKPRTNSDSYRVDPQAYRSQQNFLQQSTPNSQPKRPGYSFGTDPRYKHSGVGSHNGFSTFPGSAASHTGTSAITPPLQYGSSQSPQAPKPFNNPFTGRPLSFSTPNKHSSKPNPFAKYPYLQVEHNRSPMEYKSPYRPEGGFMNGYQGNLQALGKHFQRTMFTKQTDSTTSSTNTAISTGTYRKDLHGSSQSSSATTYSPYSRQGYQGQASPSPLIGQAFSGKQPAYDAYLAMKAAQKAGQESTNTTPLHPAIRQEYNPLFNQAYQSTQKMPSGQAVQALQQRRASDTKKDLSSGSGIGQDPKAMQDSRQILHAPQPRYSGPLAPPQPYAPPYNPGVMQQMSNPPPTNRYPYPYPAVREAPVPALTPQPQTCFQPSAQAPPQEPSDQERVPNLLMSYHERKKSLQKADEPVWIPPSLKYQEYTKHEGQQAVAVSEPSSSIQQAPSQAQDLLAQPRDFPDVPADSTSLIERMMMNLKKAAGSAA